MKRSYDEEKKLAKRNNQWGFYRNYIYMEGSAVRLEGQKQSALEKFLQVFILDCNGPQNSAPINPSFPEDLKILMQPFNPKVVCIAPGIVEIIYDLNRELNQSGNSQLHVQLHKGHIMLMEDLYPTKLCVPIAEIEASLLHEIDILTRFYSEIEKKKTANKAKKDAEKAVIKAKKQAEKAEFKAKKDTEMAAIKARKQAEKAEIKAKKDAEKAAIKARKQAEKTEIKAKKDAQKKLELG